MTEHIKKITKEQYDRAVLNHGYITKEDENSVFTDAELLGYGVYSPIVHKDDDCYVVHYLLGSTCD